MSAFRTFRKLFLLSFAFLLPFPFFARAESEAQPAPDYYPNAVVATAHPEASRVAKEILELGGNAVDAAIAAQWVLNVVEPQSSGIGGGGFFVYYDAKTNSVYTFDGREKAPAKAYPEMFLDETGKPIPFYPDRITGGLAVGVPGTLKLLKQVHDRFGSGEFKFSELFNSAIVLAQKGIPVSRRLAEAIESEKERLKIFGPTFSIFFHPDGTPLKEGDILVQKDLAKTFETIAERGVAVFYEGEIAKAIVQTVKESPVRPGLLEESDLKFYGVVQREAVYGTYRGYEIFSMGPPSSGGAALIQILNILENYNLASYGYSSHSLHLMIEAQKSAFLDRTLFLGDPDFSRIPLGMLLSKEYAKKKSQQIKFNKAKPLALLVKEASLKIKPPAGGNTSHISIRDREGNLVSYTTTIEHIFGSGMVVRDWGFLLNNELTDFDAEPWFDIDVPEDMRGRLKPNAPSPEKRPRSSMCPVLVFSKGGEPFLVAGSPGGSLIIPTVQEIVVNVIDFNMPIDKALAFPRFAARGGEVEAEAEFLENEGLIEALLSRGHTFREHKPFGNAQALLFEEKEKAWTAASDPRGEGEVRGY